MTLFLNQLSRPYARFAALVAAITVLFVGSQWYQRFKEQSTLEVIAPFFVGYSNNLSHTEGCCTKGYNLICDFMFPGHVTGITFDEGCENGLTQRLRQLGEFSRLSEVSLSGLQINSEDVIALGACVRLTKLTFSNCRFSDNSGIEFNRLANLRSVLFTGAFVTDDLLKTMHFNHNIHNIELFCTEVKGSCMDEILKTGSVKWLRIVGPSFGDVGVAELLRVHNRRDLQSLEALWLEGTTVLSNFKCKFGR
jgi:hypothetical protein